MINKDVKLDFIADFGECVKIREMLSKTITNNSEGNPFGATITVSTEHGSFTIKDIFFSSVSTDSIVVNPRYNCGEQNSNAMRIQMMGLVNKVEITKPGKTDLEKLTSAITEFKKALSELDNVELTDLNITANNTVMKLL